MREAPPCLKKKKKKEKKKKEKKRKKKEKKKKKKRKKRKKERKEKGGTVVLIQDNSLVLQQSIHSGKMNPVQTVEDERDIEKRRRQIKRKKGRELGYYPM